MQWSLYNIFRQEQGSEDWASKRDGDPSERHLCKPKPRGAAVDGWIGLHIGQQVEVWDATTAAIAEDSVVKGIQRDGAAGGEECDPVPGGEQLGWRTDQLRSVRAVLERG